MALALCPAVAALKGRQDELARLLHAVMGELLLVLTQWPEVFSLVVQSEAGGAGMAVMPEGALVRGRGGGAVGHAAGAARERFWSPGGLLLAPAEGMVWR